MDKLRFEAARKKLIENHERKGIGTLAEKTVHAVLKEYYGGGDESKEISIGGFVADAVSEDGIIEIQTRSLFRLDKKLTTLLPVCRVNVVHPIESAKYLLTIDPDSGELISKRRSPLKLNVWHGIAELYGLRKHLTDDNLTVRFPVLTVEETRLPSTGKGRRKRAKKLDKIPMDMTDEYILHNKADYSALIPDSLREQFTAVEFASACGVNTDTARCCISVLTAVGAAEECGREGRRKLWRKTQLY